MAELLQDIESLQPKYDKLQAESEPLKGELAVLNRELETLDSEQMKRKREAIAAGAEVEGVSAKLESTLKKKSLANHKLHGLRMALDPKRYPSLQETVKPLYDKTLKEAQALEREFSRLSVQEKMLQRGYRGFFIINLLVRRFRIGRFSDTDNFTIFSFHRSGYSYLR